MESIKLSKEKASEYIRRAYKIFELSYADISMSSTCTKVMGGWWPTVSVMSYSPYKTVNIDIRDEKDLLKVSDALEEITEEQTETDEKFMDRMFEGCTPEDFDRIVNIIKKGGRDE